MHTHILNIYSIWNSRFAAQTKANGRWLPSPSSILHLHLRLNLNSVSTKDGVKGQDKSRYSYYIEHSGDCDCDCRSHGFLCVFIVLTAANTGNCRKVQTNFRSKSVFDLLFPYFFFFVAGCFPYPFQLLFALSSPFVRHALEEQMSLKMSRAKLGGRFLLVVFFFKFFWNFWTQEAAGDSLWLALINHHSLGQR